MDLKVSQDCAQDIRQVFSVENRLSLEAKGFLILLRTSERQALTCPQPSLSRLLSIGVKGLRSAISELERHGLIEVRPNLNRWGAPSASSYRLSMDRAKSALWEGET